MKKHEIASVMATLPGVRRTDRGGLPEWRFHGRVVARLLDETHLVIRTEFDARDSILRRHADTFSVPSRFAKHMMVVADLGRGDAGAIEDAIHAAWELQRRGD